MQLQKLEDPSKSSHIERERTEKNFFLNSRKFPQTIGLGFPDGNIAQERDENKHTTRHIIVKFQSIENKSFQKIS